MKKIAALILTAVLAAGCFAGVTAAGAEEAAENQTELSQEQKADRQEAAEMLKLLNGAPVFTGETVNRLDFLVTMGKMIQMPEQTQVEDYFYGDVKSYTENYGYVYAAYELGWISQAENFETERGITGYEAVKLLVNALGYGMIAENRGGFPAGYLSVGKTLDLYDGIDIGERPLNQEEARLLLFRALCAPALNQTVYGRKELYHTGDTLLAQVHHIRAMEDVVSRTEYNTLTGGEEIGKGNRISIGDESYTCHCSSYDMLGVECRVFIREDDQAGVREAVYIRPLAERKTIRLEDFLRRDGARLYYLDEKDREHTVSIAADSEVVYNGRKVTKNMDRYFTRGVGEIILMDNDGDRTYDVVFINRYAYLTAMQYNSLTKTIPDKNDAKWSLSLSQAAYEILDETGLPLDLYDITEGDVFRVIKSEDGGFIQAIRGAIEISGAVTRIEEEQLYIGDTGYYRSDYFNELFLSQAKLGGTGQFMVTQDGALVSAAMSAGQMQYGYLFDAAWRDELERRLEVRIFDQSGVIAAYRLRKKLTLDGESGCGQDRAFEKMQAGGVFTPQLVRFSVDGQGEINTLDFATTTLPERQGVYPNEKDRLTLFYNNSEMQYKSNLTSFGAFCNVGGSIVFLIPDDLTELEKFEVRSGSSAFVHDNRYTPEVYDVDATGSAGALVCKGTALAYRIFADAPAMVIKEVYRGLDEEGRNPYMIYGWYDGAFITLTLDDDVVVSKTASGGTPVDSVHPLLSGGDMIRFAADADNHIHALEVVFDARKGVFAPNVSNFNADTSSSPMYREGMIYSKGNSFVAMSSHRTGGRYDFTPNLLRYVSTGSLPIVAYDAETGMMRPMTVDDIRTWTNDGENAHYAVFTQSSFVTKTIVLYERTEARQ